MDDRSPLGACHCFAARQAARFVSQIYERHLGRAGVTNTQFSILALLKQLPDATMSALAAAMAMDRTTLLRAIRPLQRDELIEGRATSARSRVILLHLTEKGRGKLAAAYPLWEAAQLEFETQTGAERANELRQTLLNLTS
jgi:DNA-binding MarR family transcriptional regulator